MSEPNDASDIYNYRSDIRSVVAYPRNIEYLRSDYAGASDMIDCE